jgi:uncharacterized membrane protein
MEKRDPGSKKYSELEPNLQAFLFQMLLKEEDKNQHLYLGAVERAIKALFLLNSGGVVTILAYMNHLGNSGSFNHFLIGSLIIFLIGIISALIVVVIDYLFLLDRLNKFNEDTKKYLENNISYNEMQFNQNCNVSHKMWYFSIFSGFFSLACIIAGIGLGMTGYFCA